MMNKVIYPQHLVAVTKAIEALPAPDDTFGGGNGYIYSASLVIADDGMKIATVRIVDDFWIADFGVYGDDINP